MLGSLERGLGVAVQRIGAIAIIREDRRPDFGVHAQHSVIQAKWVMHEGRHRALEEPCDLIIPSGLRQH